MSKKNIPLVLPHRDWSPNDVFRDGAKINADKTSNKRPNAAGFICIISSTLNNVFLLINTPFLNLCCANGLTITIPTNILEI